MNSWMSDEQLRLLTPSLIDGRPNTYTFTKALAENLLKDEASDLPVAIIRPSIIGSTVSEPMPVSSLYSAIMLFYHYYNLCRVGLTVFMVQLEYLWQ